MHVNRLGAVIADQNNENKNSTKVCSVPNRVLYAFSGSPPLHPASLNYL